MRALVSADFDSAAFSSVALLRAATARFYDRKGFMWLQLGYSERLMISFMISLVPP